MSRAFLFCICRSRRAAQYLPAFLCILRAPWRTSAHIFSVSQCISAYFRESQRTSARRFCNNAGFLQKTKRCFYCRKRRDAFRGPAFQRIYLYLRASRRISAYFRESQHASARRFCNNAGFLQKTKRCFYCRKRRDAFRDPAFQRIYLYLRASRRISAYFRESQRTSARRFCNNAGFLQKTKGCFFAENAEMHFCRNAGGLCARRKCRQQRWDKGKGKSKDKSGGKGKLGSADIKIVRKII